jgi:hypothetical protein
MSTNLRIAALLGAGAFLLYMNKKKKDDDKDDEEESKWPLYLIASAGVLYVVTR